MRASALFAGTVVTAAVLMTGNASAKGSIEEANITGPGLDGGMRIAAGDTEGIWESGIDVVGGSDDARSASVGGLGLTLADLGPRYLVTYRFESTDEIVRQELYPYASGGPVTYTPAGQSLTVGINIVITDGWYQGSRGFFDYLVDHGLPERNPVASAAAGEAAPSMAQEARTVPWAVIVVVLLGLVAVALGTLAVRRRVFARSRMTR